MKFAIFQESRRAGRAYNQDRMAHSYTRDALMLVVADGMGGHLHGEVAAQITVELFVDQFQKQARSILKNPWTFIRDSVHRSHDAILSYASNNHLLETPRTTCVAAIIQDGLLYWGHVGDSRFYYFRDGRCMAQTKDHSKVQQMVNDGVISAAEAENHPERNKIYNCIGGLHLPEIELGGKVPIQDRDTLLLCTDGLWGEVPHAELVRQMTSLPPQVAVTQLLDLAEMNGGRHADNLTAVAINWMEEDAHPSESIVSTRTMPMAGFTTQIDALDVDRIIKEDQAISEDEIEKAIREIQEALTKFSK